MFYKFVYCIWIHNKRDLSFIIYFGAPLRLLSLKIEMMRIQVVRVSVITSNIDMVMHCFDSNIVFLCILLHVYNVNCFVSGIFTLDDTRITKMFIFHLFFFTGVYCFVQVRTISQRNNTMQWHIHVEVYVLG